MEYENNSAQIRYISRYAYPEQIEHPMYVEFARDPHLNVEAYKARQAGEWVLNVTNSFVYPHNITNHSQEWRFSINSAFSPSLPKDLSYIYTMRIGYIQDPSNSLKDHVQYISNGESAGLLQMTNFSLNLYQDFDYRISAGPTKFLNLGVCDLYYHLQAKYDHSRCAYDVNVDILSYMERKNLI